MKDFEEIGKKLPYSETDEYVDTLLQRCANKAVAEAPKTRRRNTTKRIGYWSAPAAAAAVLAFIIVGNASRDNAYQAIEESSPISQVLSQMSDEQLAEVNYYTVEDIPEY